MKKFWTKLVAIALGAVMALGIGFVVSGANKAVPVHAAASYSFTGDTIVFADQGLENGVQYTSAFTNSVTSITFSGGSNDGKYYTTGSGMRTYGGGSITVSSTSTMSKLEFTWDGSYKPSSDVANPTGYDPSSSCWAGLSNSVVLTRPSGSGHWRLQQIKITLGSTPAHTHSWDEGTVTTAPTCTEEGVMTYHCSGCDETKTEAIPATGHNYIDGVCSVCGAEEPHIIHAGTEQDPYTVADARLAVDLEMGVSNVYATGIVSEIKTEYSTQYKNVSFNISEDGTTTSNQLEAYREKSEYSVTVKVGDIVIIYGNLTKYSSTYEFGQDCKIVYLESGDTPTPVATNYVLEPASGSNNSYAGNCDIAIDGITWNLTGNSQMQPWRIGGKSLDAVDRTLYSKTAISEEVSKIEVIHGTASGIVVNSWTVIVASDAEFENIISTLTPTFATSDTTTINRPSGVSWKNAYYKFIYNVTVTGTSNKFIEFTRATFYFEQESAGVAAWCASFLSTVKCDVTGQKAPDKTAWDTMKTSYTVLDDADKLTLKTLSNEATVRYDYIIAKYGTTNYENFIGRTITPLGNSRMVLSNIIGNDTVIPVIILVSVLALTSIGAYVFIRKRKEN